MIFLVPARAGSKRLPGKNTRMFCGLPLWMWSIMTACRVATDADIIIASSDDFSILESTWGMQRSADLCKDGTLTSEVVADVWLRFQMHDALCLLQPTSPTRSDSLVRMMLAHGGSCRSVTNGEPNGQCYVYRREMTMADVETERGHDIDTLEQFEAAERHMMERFK